MNENNALPLEKGAKVSCFSNSSVNLVYGGTGSGNIDASSADTLKTALEKSGFEVNKKLWNFYSKGEGKQVRQKNCRYDCRRRGKDNRGSVECVYR